MKFYCCQAMVESHGVSRQVPTFYLDPRIQGIRSEADARLIVKSILNPLELEEITVHVFATIVEKNDGHL